MKEASSINTGIYEFADFRIDVGERILERLDTGERIALPDKAFETLCHLVRNPNRLVSKSELLARVWPDAFVEENNLNKSIHVIRKALGERNGDRQYIETVKKHGYRFAVDVRPVTPALDDGPDADDAIFANGSPANGQNGAAVSITPGSSRQTGSDPLRTTESTDNDGAAAEYGSRTRPASAAAGKRLFIPLAAIAGLLIVAAIVGFYLSRGAPSGQNLPISKLPGIAVLPLRPVVSETRDRGLELAVVDSLIHKLSDSNSFKVRDLSAMRTLIDRTEDAVTLGRELDTEYVIDSTYQKGDARVRVTSQLVNVRTGDSELTFRSEAEDQDIFKLQDIIANQIGNAVMAKFGLSPNNFASVRGTRNGEAFDLFYEAQYLVDKNTMEDSAKAAELLGQALELDPNFAQGWALRAQAYCQFAHNGGDSPKNLFSVAEPLLERALALDAGNQVAYSVRGLINRDYHWDFPAAYRVFDRAIRENPESVYPHRYLAGLYYADGRFAEAVAEQRKTVAINPTSVIDRNLLGHFLLGAGQNDEGVKELQRVKTMDPSFAPAYFVLWTYYDRVGEGGPAYDNFVRFKELNGAEKDRIAKYRDAFRRGGWPAVIRVEQALLVSKYPAGEYSGNEYYIAAVSAIAGQKETAFEYLEQALKHRLIGMAQIKVDRKLDSLRGDPRFLSILERTGLGERPVK